MFNESNQQNFVRSVVINQSYHRFMLPAFLLLDLMAIGCCYLIASRIWPTPANQVVDYLYLFLGIFLLGWIVLSFPLQLFQERRGRDLRWHLEKALWGEILLMLAVLAYQVFTPWKVDSRGFLLLFLIFQFIAIMLVRAVRRLIMTSLRKRGFNTKRLFFVGMNEEFQQISQWMAENVGLGYRYTNQIILHNGVQDVCGTLAQHLETVVVDDVVIGGQSFLGDKLDRLVDIAENVGARVKLIQPFSDHMAKRLNMEYFGPFPVIQVREEPLAKFHNRFLKRSLDVVFTSLVFLLIYWWQHLITAIFIKVNSPGPVIFKQLRVGRNSIPFTCNKFRTMQADASNELGQGEITSDGDERITKVGVFLRKTSLDEFPQFINVLKGDMSVVGPRPHMLEEDTAIRDKVSKYRIRQFVKPGITGWAQVNGYRGGTTDLELMQKRIDLDIWYIENWSLWLDLKIMWMTFWQMITFNTGAH